MKSLKPNTDERPMMIVFGIVLLYSLVLAFVAYLLVLARISLLHFFILIGVFTIIYFPRFLIISKLRNKDIIKISEDSILVNNQELPFVEIKNFRCIEHKPCVIFVFNSNLIVYNEAEFNLTTEHGLVSFSVTGSEKIKLMNEFFNQLLVK